MKTARTPPSRAARRLLQVSAIASLALAASDVAADHLRYNRTPSVPTGLYWVERSQVAIRGHYVTFCPGKTPWMRVAQQRGYLGYGPCHGRLSSLLKVVAAIPGDHVHVGPSGVRINGVLWPDSAPLSHDSQGRPMPQASPTTYRVPPGTFLALSDHAATGFDGRYFGPVPMSNIQGLAIRLR